VAEKNMLNRIITYLLVLFAVVAFAQEQKEMEVPKGSKSAKATKKRTEDRKEAGMKEYEKAVKRQQKIQTKETRKRMKATKKRAEKYNQKRPDNFFEKLFRRKQKKK
jgi:biopolymer transport protein ExbD